MKEEIPKVALNVAYKIIDDKVVTIFLDNQPGVSDIVYIFNETGTKIWELIDGEKSIHRIIGKIQKEFNVSQRQATEEVENFINELLDNKLITVK